MKKILFNLFVPILMLTSCVEQISPTNSVEYCEGMNYEVPNSQFYDSLLQEYHIETGSPGVVAMVDKPNVSWAGAHGFADLTSMTSMQTCHQFQIGSITKMFTAATIMILQEEGLLSLEDKVSDHLPELRGNIEHVESMTIKQLLNHTAGVPDYYFMQSYILDLMNHPETIDRSAEKALKKYNYGKKADFKPGSSWNYSNSGYVILGWIVSRVSQMPFENVVKEKIIDRLGLWDTYMEAYDNPRKVKDYLDLTGRGTLIEATRYDNSVIGTAEGGAISTVQDLTLFARGLFTGDLLRPASLEEMMHVPCPPDAIDVGICGYTLGLSYWKDTSYGDAFGHLGGEVGMESLLLYFVEHDAVGVYFKNRNGPSRKQFLFDMLNK